MSRAGSIIMGLIVASVLSVVTASSASAFSWWVETSGKGERVLWAGEKAPFNKESLVKTPIKFKFSEKSVTVETKCEGLTYEEGYLEGLAKLGAKSITFESCTVLTPTSCSITPTKIVTRELVGEIKEVGSAVEFEIKPKTGTVIAEFSFAGSSCSINGFKVKLGGVARGEITNPRELTTEKGFKLLTKENGLTVNGSPITESTGDPGYSATSGWSAH